MVDYARRGAAPARAKKRKVSWWAWLLVIPLLIFALPTLIILALGLLPTIVAAFIDRREEKYAAYCVGGFNLCGVIPYLLALWLGGNTMIVLKGVLLDPFAWLAMYGAAAIGWGCHYYIPEVVAKFMAMRDRQEIVRLRKRQQEIVEEWGPGVLPPRMD